MLAIVKQTPKYPPSTREAWRIACRNGPNYLPSTAPHRIPAVEALVAGADRTVMLPQTSQAGASACMLLPCWLSGSATMARRRFGARDWGRWTTCILERMDISSTDSIWPPGPTPSNGLPSSSAWVHCRCRVPASVVRRIARSSSRAADRRGRHRALASSAWGRWPRGSRDELHRQPAEDVIDQRSWRWGCRGCASCRWARSARARTCAPAIRPARRIAARRETSVAMVSIRPPMVRAFLGHGDEDFAGRAVFVQADGDVALMAGDVELVRDARGACRAGAGAAGARRCARRSSR